MIDDRSVALALAKEHLKTELTDFVIVGFNRNLGLNARLETIFECRDRATLELLFEKFIEKAEEKVSNELDGE